MTLLWALSVDVQEINAFIYDRNIKEVQQKKAQPHATCSVLNSRQTKLASRKINIGFIFTRRTQATPNIKVMLLRINLTGDISFLPVSLGTLWEVILGLSTKYHHYFLQAKR